MPLLGLSINFERPQIASRINLHCPLFQNNDILAQLSYYGNVNNNPLQNPEILVESVN